MLKGYELGAEDYVTKPFPMSVFQKKLAVVLGRLTKQYGGDTYEDGTLTINFSEMSATLSGKPLAFTPLEYRLLKILMKIHRLFDTASLVGKAVGRRRKFCG